MISTPAPGFRLRFLVLAVAGVSIAAPAIAQRTVKPVLHGRHWVAVTGKPLAATAGALIFARGGNAVDAACAMLAATSTMWDTLGWGGETQALIFDPRNNEVVGINALGTAPTGASASFYRERGFVYPPEYGPLAAVTPGTPGGLIVMLADYGTMSLAEVLEPAIQMADGYPIERAQADNMERRKEVLQEWPDSARVFLPHLSSSEEGDGRAAPRAGEIFRQPDLLDTLRKLVDAEAAALKQGKTREQALAAAYDRFYRGDIAEEFVRGSEDLGGLVTMADLDRWQVHIEEPVRTNYRGVDVYKLTSWVQGPVMLQALNILENADLRPMGYNSARYIHTLYQAMNLAFADRDFYYGDPYYPPEEPLEGLLSKDYARARYESIDRERNNENVRPGNPYDFQEGENPFLDLLEQWTPIPPAADAEGEQGFQQASADPRRLHALGRAPVRPGEQGFQQASADPRPLPRLTYEEAFVAGTTSIQAADAAGWVVSVTPSGAWIPAVIAGRTGIGMSQRMQSFVLDPGLNPYNLPEPGKRPRATLTPGMALLDGSPYLSFAVQGGDTQDQNLLQFFLNVVEFGMNVQQAAEAANITSHQMQSSFGAHESRPGDIDVRRDVPPWVREELGRMGYRVRTLDRTSGPITAIWFDRENGTMWGGASDFGEDYGIAW